MDMRNDQDDFELSAQIENAIYLSELYDKVRGGAKKDHSNIFSMNKEKFMLKLKTENHKGKVSKELADKLKFQVKLGTLDNNLKQGTLLAGLIPKS